jgi:hypothetical protein
MGIYPIAPHIKLRYILIMEQPPVPEQTTKKQGFHFKMDSATIIMLAIAGIFIFLAYQRHDGTLQEGLLAGAKAFYGLLPLLIGVFIVVGLADYLIPKDVVARLLGESSGLRGLLVATVLGAITPGGPFVSFPLVASLYKAGAAIGPVVAFVTAWSLLALSRLPLEIGLVGVRLTVIRVVSSLIFPPLAGFIASILFK